MDSVIGSDWWRTSTLDDPTEQRLAPLFQILLAGLVVAILLTAPIFLIVLDATGAAAVVGAQALAAAFATSALITLRYGRFQRAVLLATTGLLLALALMLPLLGLHASTPFLLVFMFPICLAALLAGPRTALIVVVLSIGILGCTALGDSLNAPLVGSVPPC